MHMLRKIRNSTVFMVSYLAVLQVAATPALPIIVDASISTSSASGRTELFMSVTNCGRDILRTDAANMPWGENTIGLTLRRASEMPTGELKQNFPLRHVAPEEIVIPPGGRVTGSVDLTERFPDLASSKDKSFVLFWTYNSGLLIKGSSRQISGVVDIPDDATNRAKSSPTCVRPRSDTRS